MLGSSGGVVEGRDPGRGRRRARWPPCRRARCSSARSSAASHAPISAFVNMLAAVPRELVVALDQMRQQKEQAAKRRPGHSARHKGVPVMAMTKDQLVDELKGMTRPRARQRLKEALEEEFGVSAAAAAGRGGRAAAAGGGGGAEAAEEEKTEFDVVITERRLSKIPVIKVDPRGHGPGPQGGQGDRRRGPQGRQGGHLQGRLRQAQGGARGGRRDRRDQVAPSARTGSGGLRRRVAPGPSGRFAPAKSQPHAATRFGLASCCPVSASGPRFDHARRTRHHPPARAPQRRVDRHGLARPQRVLGRQRGHARAHHPPRARARLHAGRRGPQPGHAALARRRRVPGDGGGAPRPAAPLLPRGAGRPQERHRRLRATTCCCSRATAPATATASTRTSSAAGTTASRARC